MTNYITIQNRKRNKNRMLKCKSFIIGLKKGQSCELCGWNEHPSILHFHHIDKETKKDDISMLHSISRIKSEINKCILLCPNCHSWLHFKESSLFKELTKFRTTESMEKTS